MNRFEKIKALSRNIPSSNEYLNLDRYASDHSQKRREADAWRRGDFKTMIKESMEDASGGLRVRRTDDNNRMGGISEDEIDRRK